MINKDKVNEILADMKEEERKKQEAIEAEVDKFLEGRLEYYVAMVLNGKVGEPEDLLEILINDGCENYNIAMVSIDSALAEYDWYICFIFGDFECHIVYMSIHESSTDIEQPRHVKKRQIELGLRPDTKKAMDLHRKWSEDEINEDKNSSSPIPIVFIYLVIVILLILFFVFK